MTPTSPLACTKKSVGGFHSDESPCFCGGSDLQTGSLVLHVQDNLRQITGGRYVASM